MTAAGEATHTYQHPGGDVSWMKRAACRGQPLTLFFPEGGMYPQKPKRIKLICQRCPVMTKCAEFSLQEYEQEYGIWGGMTRNERRARYLGLKNTA